MKAWFKEGEHWVWFSAASVSISVVLVLGLLSMISVRGLVHFWPHEVYDYQLKTDDGQFEQIVGELHDTKLKEFKNQQTGVIEKITQFLMKVGNRDIYGIDFRWINTTDIIGRQDRLDDDVTVIERFEYGNVYGHLQAIIQNGEIIAEQEQVLPMMQQLVSASQKLYQQINRIEKVTLGGINYQLEQLRLDQKKFEAEGRLNAEVQATLDQQRAELNAQFKEQQSILTGLYSEFNQLGEVTLRLAGGQVIHVPFKSIVRFWLPNNMTRTDKLGFFFNSMGHFLLGDPREANTEGGVFPAIVGTINMVILMAIFVTPMGVIAAVYMSEYAKEGMVLKIVRISINNLAGVPSIVFGIFGLGFFVYIIGGSIDEMFYEYALPSPTFGTPALLWASLTMALLTLPVVIVSTQEGLSRIPTALREGGLALGATQSETIMKIVLPMSMPAIMTGLILAVARAAGEVAPLMLVGVVKLAPELPIDFNAPFIHLDRKFMHLGFHIYDVGFQSPNVEASQPLVYATSLLLVVIIVSLNLGAITIRNRLREKYKALDN